MPLSEAYTARVLVVTGDLHEPGARDGVLQVFTILLFTFYLAADGPRLRRTICSVLPPRRQHEVLRVWELATHKTGAFISSRFVMAVISSIFHTPVFWLLALSYGAHAFMFTGLTFHIIPLLTEQGAAQVYDFSENVVPGAADRDPDDRFNRIGRLELGWIDDADLRHIQRTSHSCYAG